MSIPRRADMLRWTAAERAINEAVIAVESLAPDVRLTEAVTMLDRARARVADFIDGKCCARDSDSDGSCPLHSAPGTMRRLDVATGHA